MKYQVGDALVRDRETTATVIDVDGEFVRIACSNGWIGWHHVSTIELFWRKVDK